jgi:hypothetical protein
MSGEDGLVTRWGKVPAWWLLHPRMDADRFCVMAAMATYADETGRCEPSQATLARHLRRSRPWVNGVVARLAADGFLEKTGRSRRNGGNTSCEYRLCMEPPVMTSDAVTGVTAPDAVQDSPRHRGDQSQAVVKQIQNSRLTARADQIGQSGPEIRGTTSGTVEEVPRDWRPSTEDLTRGHAICPEADLVGHATLFVHRCRAKGYRYTPGALGDAWLAWLIEDHGPGGRRSRSARTVPGTPEHTSLAQTSARISPRPQDRGERLDDRMSAWAAAASAPRVSGRV